MSADYTYKVVDYFDWVEEVLGEGLTFEEAQDIITERDKETNGSCECFIIPEEHDDMT